jgi:hypothetical protein
MSWADVGTVMASVLASGGFVAIVNTFANRRKVKVDAADVLSGAALEQVNSMLEQVRSARRDAEGARRDAEEARQSATRAWGEANEARRETMAVAAQLRRLTTEILSPAATLERLREMVSAGGGGTQNGTTRYR